ncbi:MAG: hypothetical protein F6J90_36825 [Moorea sp. SIOASIH]|uniref:hypothetical protein n=1 Tax=Moorena sp. SIOASIH TaxID=2607817 RepID=UPI0013BDA0AD|nr:hypothetical protein [Moorena sp. SIOASIH]NEO41596.1 hypothetical protein [Moorena sp. SIOASIH]
MLLSTVQGILLLFTVGLNLHIFYLYLQLQQQVHLLSEQLRLQQKLMDRAFTEIHNNSLQQLAFVIRELQIREMSQQELIEYLREVYQDIQTSVANLKE